MNRINFLFDCLRAPYDMVHVVQVAEAVEGIDLSLSGNSLDPQNRKVVFKLSSWGIRDLPHFDSYDSLDQAVSTLRGQGRYLVGTSPHATRNFYELDLISRDYAIVFGTETSGLTYRKMSLMDENVALPMSRRCSFLTLPVVVSAIAYEYYRQRMDVEE